MSFRDIQLQNIIKKNEVNLKKPDFVEVISFNKGKIDLKLLQRPGYYKDVTFIGSVTPKVGDRGVLFFIGGTNVPIYESFARNLSNKPGEWYQETPNSVKSSYPYIPLFESVKTNLDTYYKNFITNPENATIQQIMDLYNLLGSQYNIDPNMLIAQAWQESTFHSNITSPVGAGGWAQFMPGTWPGYAPKGYTDLKYRIYILKSIEAQFKYMAELLTGENGDMYFALRGYNGGAGWRKRSLNSTENIWYPANIFYHYNTLKSNKILDGTGVSGSDKAKPYLRNNTSTSMRGTSKGLIHLQSFT